MRIGISMIRSCLAHLAMQRRQERGHRAEELTYDAEEPQKSQTSIVRVKNNKCLWTGAKSREGKFMDREGRNECNATAGELLHRTSRNECSCTQDYESGSMSLVPPPHPPLLFLRFGGLGRHLTHPCPLPRRYYPHYSALERLWSAKHHRERREGGGGQFTVT